MTEFVVPPATLRWLDAAPRDRPVMVLLRHSARPPIPPGETGDELSLTEDGVRLAEALGALLGQRLASVRSSPVLRCVQTAEALSRGAGVPLDCSHDRLLGAPGVFVNDPVRAWEQSWSKRPYEELLNAVVDGRTDLAGFAHPRRAAFRLMEHMAEHAQTPGVHVFLTHDSVVLPTAAHLLGLPLRRPDWPWYLDALVVWRNAGAFELRYRDYACQRDPAAVAVPDELDEGRVLAFHHE